MAAQPNGLQWFSINLNSSSDTHGTISGSLVIILNHLRIKEKRFKKNFFLVIFPFLHKEVDLD